MDGREQRLRQRMDSRMGFTLMELMVVVAIIAFVTAAVVPTFGLSLQKARQREAANLIVSAVYAARSRAARTGRCHRVRVYMRTPGEQGGEGGMVAVDESNVAECSRAQNGGVWLRLSYRSVWRSIDPDFGDAHAGLVGEDIAILDVNRNAGGQDFMLFEPSGGLFINTADPRVFRVIAYGAGNAPTGVTTQAVAVSSGGSVRYTTVP